MSTLTRYSAIPYTGPAPTMKFILSEGGGRRERRISGGTPIRMRRASPVVKSIAVPPEILRRFAAQDKAFQ